MIYYVDEITCKCGHQANDHRQAVAGCDRTGCECEATESSVLLAEIAIQRGRYLRANRVIHERNAELNILYDRLRDCEAQARAAKP